MTRIIAAALIALTLGANVATAEPALNDAIRTGGIVSTHGIFDAGW